jgi:hypothetical protein
VLITLVLPGRTLAPLIERLGLGQTEQRRREELEARLRLTHPGGHPQHTNDNAQRHPAGARHSERPGGAEQPPP